MVQIIVYNSGVNRRVLVHMTSEVKVTFATASDYRDAADVGKDRYLTW